MLGSPVLIFCCPNIAHEGRPPVVVAVTNLLTVNKIDRIMAQKTTSTHRSAFVQATHRFDILGYSTLKSLGVRTTVRSGSFHAGGLPWALVCCFDEIPKPGGVVQLASISLELSKNETRVQVVAMAGLRIDETAGTGQFPAAVWQSSRAKTFGAWQRDAVAWELGVPAAFRDKEARHVDADADRLTIHCTVDVLQKYSAAAAVSDCFVSVPLPPSIALDFHRLLKGRCLPDVTFVVDDDDTEIHAHKLVLAARSSVFRAAFFHGSMKERSMRRIGMDDMSASTLRAMLDFIYTDEQQPRSMMKEEGVVAMAHDLLVAADLYDLERLRLMCEKILCENMDADNVMTTLMQAHGRPSCRQLEASCIEFMASNPDVYEAVEATLDVARNSLSSASSTSSSSPHKSKSTYNPYASFRGTHEFIIRNLSAARQTSHADDEDIRSGTFQVGGYEWAIDLGPWQEGKDGKEHIGIALVLLSAPVASVKASACFRIDDPKGKSPAFSNGFGNMCVYTKAEQFYGIQQFITLESATEYLGHDGSLAIHGEFKVATVSLTSTANTNVGATVAVPPTDLAWHLEQLLVSEQESDIKFLVKQSKIRAHS
ncbi:hypothetical protein QYE76_035884 [Lolium multiflorum]|uniref:Uncharacterized protein n=1 Tax=Lolium multiflorum TaxID=4521 RepID=A0AAD8R0N8_LOLMU|nr:hypothetical protein QYE76_035884 [Lolium multiflorum]